MDSFRWEVKGRRGSDVYTIELRFEGERLHIAYRGIDRGDGRGPHDEELKLAPGDILAVRYEVWGLQLVVEHTVHGLRSTRTVEEELPLGHDDDRSILVLDRFVEYLREYGIGGDSADGLSAYSASFKHNLSLEERNWARAAGRPYIDEVELPCDEAKRKRLRRLQQVRVVIFFVYFFAGMIGSLFMFGLFESWGVLAFVLYLIGCIVLGVWLNHRSSAALWNQSVRIGPGQLMFHRWRGRQRRNGRGKNYDDLYYNDTSRVPFCVSSIAGYRVDEEEIVVFGSFWDNYVQYDADDSLHMKLDGSVDYEFNTERTLDGRFSGMRYVGEFKIARTFSDEDELQLLTCLDRLVPSGSSDAESFDAELVDRGTGGLGSFDTSETDHGPFDAGSPA